MRFLLWLVLTAISAAGLHFGLDLVLWLAIVIGGVLALFGSVLIVVVLDDDGSIW